MIEFRLPSEGRVRLLLYAICRAPHFNNTTKGGLPLEFFDYDPDYPIDDGNEDGLDPITRDELRRIEEEEKSFDDEVPDLPW